MKEKKIIKTDAHKKIEQMSNDVLHLVMCEFIERQRECLGLDDRVDIFITAEKGGDGIDVHIETESDYPKFKGTVKTNCT